jgi:hypothetical protein
LISIAWASIRLSRYAVTVIRFRSMYSLRRAFTRASSRAALASSSVAKPPTYRGLLMPVSWSLTRITYDQVVPRFSAPTGRTGKSDDEQNQTGQPGSERLIHGVSSNGMDAQAILGILGLAAAVFSTFWATGGWSALRRRSIQQELDLAKELAEGETRKRLTEHAENQIAIYLYRIKDKPPEVWGPLSFLVAVGGIFFVIADVFPNSSILRYIFYGLLIPVIFSVYAMLVRSGWIWWNRRRHDRLLQAAREAADKASRDAKPSSTDA